MVNWQEALAPFVRNVEERFDALRYRLNYMLGGLDPIKIVPYRGYGTPDTLYLKGRVLEDKGITRPTDNDTVWDNLVNTFKRFESDEVPHAQVAVRFQESEQEVTADEEGIFEVWIEPTRPLATDRLWQPVELELRSPTSDEQEEPPRATGHVLVPPPSAQFAVISDIDDTILQTDAANVVRMARSVFLENARTRLPFAGVAAFYHALQDGAHGTDMNPLFYVSSSPWNLYDLLSEFFELQGVPLGPIFLRNWGISRDELLPTKHRDYKLGVIRQMLDLYPDLPFILIGDSGQEDPEIYHAIVHEYPGRVLAVYVRNVSRGLERQEAVRALAKEVLEAGSTLLLADDSLAMAKHALDQGWIAEEHLPEIRAEKKKDEGPPTQLETLLGAEEKDREKGPKVVIKEEVSDDEPALSPGTLESATQAGDSEEQAPPTVVVEGEEAQDSE
jgi:phosphatidate phosphatase APP1